ncbi:MAG: hypothetical protein AB7N70_15805 [Dehalococcoidia bacterium]
MEKKSGFALAAAAAAFFTMADVPLAQAADGVHCMGINACKGQTECKTAAGACNGTNACKGQGWLTVASAEECADKGGHVVE